MPEPARHYQPSGKIIVVGPVAPFRGGIAQHTTHLANALSAIAQTSVVSFTGLYPRLLYPGRFLSEDSLLRTAPPIEPLLDAIRPSTWSRAARHIAEQIPACVVIPWWTVFLAPCYLYLTRRLRCLGIPVLFYCHNIVDHEGSAWKHWLAFRVLRQGSAFVVPARDGIDLLRHLLGDVDVHYAPHPVFDHFPGARGLLPRRAEIELLFFGFIRPYKGVDILLEALAGIDDLPIHLSIVGEPWGQDESVWRGRIRRGGLSERVEFVPRYLSEQETAEYFDRADAVVLPYRSATGTGVLSLAYHYGKPVIGSRVGGLQDGIRDRETGLLVTPGDPAALRAAIRQFAQDGLPRAARNIHALVKTMNWDDLAREILAVTKRRTESRAD